MEHGVPSQSALQRSKSNGGPGVLQHKTNATDKPTAVAAASAKNVELPDLSHFPEHTQNLLRKIATGSVGMKFATL